MLRKSFATKKSGTAEAATDCTPKPSDYELGSLESRAAARALHNARCEFRRTIRLILCCPDEPLNLHNSTCTRQVWPDGTLFEQLMFEGNDAELSDEQLEAFIQSFPIQANSEMEARL